MRILIIAAFAALCCTGFAVEKDPNKPQSIQPDTLNEPWAVKWWMPRHKEKLARIKQGNVDLLMIGDSITHGWENKGKSLWAKYYAPRNAVDLGYSGDRTENVIWRLQNGEVEGIKPKLAVLMIGTNNAGHRKEKSEETALGIKTILAELEQRLPETKVLLLAIFPRGATPDHPLRKLNEKTNSIIKAYADNKRVFWLDINDKFLEADGTLPKSIMPDLLHPNAKGYEIWAETMEPHIAKLMGEPTFSRPTIDFGIVVSDVEKSLKWYKQVVGFKASGDFTVQPNVANDAGLTKIEKPIKIYKLKLSEGAGATTVKLMQIPDASRKNGGTEYIHSQLGMSYMTIFVTDTAAALERAAKLGHKPLAKGPVDLGGGKMFLALLKDPDGNFVELVGPSGK